jgi:ABC-type transport system involved in multi-copper enzyme maturation permease subunit
MNLASQSSVKLGPLGAVLRRECRDALINRYFQIFAGLCLLGGIGSILFSEETNSIAFLLLQVALYFVSLFALLAGVSSAQAEREEWHLLFAQPVWRAVYVVGKFAAYLLIFAGLLVLLFAPGAFAGAEHCLILYSRTLLLAAIFLALGLAAGFAAHDRSQALILGVAIWLVLLCGMDLIALFAARWSNIQKFPDLWVSFLMLNPLDAFRIQALFALEQIPAEAANKTPLASWWIAHGGLWFSAISVFWSVILVGLTSLRLSRWEE